MSTFVDVPRTGRIGSRAVILAQVLNRGNSGWRGECTEKMYARRNRHHCTADGDWRTVQQMHATFEEEEAMNGLVGKCRSTLGRAVMVGGLALGALVATTTSAQAQTGDVFNFKGSASLFDAPGSGGADLFIAFVSGVQVTQTTNGVFAAAGVATNDLVGMTDLTISSSGVVGLPVSNFVTVGPFTFTLTGADLAPGGFPNFGPLQLVQLGTSTFGGFSVFGTVTGPGLASPYNFTGVYSANWVDMTPTQVYNQVDKGGTLPASFSGEFKIGAAVVTPEPSTYILFASGLGILGLVALRRRGMQS